MNRLIGIVMLALACGASVFLIAMTRYILGFRSSNLTYVTGYLEKTETVGNVFRGHAVTGKWHKHWTNYTYVYRVDGQPYSICGGRSGQKKDLPRRVTVAAQKNAPKNAVIPQFGNFPSKWIVCYLLLGTALFYAVGFYCIH